MRLAIKEAQVAVDGVDYINAHGTATPLGDIAETFALKQVFGAAAKKLVISSTKSEIGHTLGASGGIELIVTVLTIEHNVIPPTINLDNPGEGCDLDYCPNVARDCRINVGMSNSFGFGGHNACIVVRRFE
jgi:3-oxoacyl-[acyl-carrier-protein] synthase II